MLTLLVDCGLLAWAWDFKCPSWRPLESHVVHVHIVQFALNEIGYLRSIALGGNGDGSTNVAFEKLHSTNAAESAPNSNLLRNHCYLVNLVWVRIVPYTPVILVNISIRLKSSSKCLEVNKQTALSIVSNFELLVQLDLVRVQPQIQTQNSPSWSVRKAEFLYTARN
ncbi:hypothetical protein Trydic_g19285 [Trypoxylus dichotomus]